MVGRWDYFQQRWLVTAMGPLHFHPGDGHTDANVPPTGGGRQGDTDGEPKAWSREPRVEMRGEQREPNDGRARGGIAECGMRNRGN